MIETTTKFFDKVNVKDEIKRLKFENAFNLLYGSDPITNYLLLMSANRKKDNTLSQPTVTESNKPELKTYTLLNNVTYDKVDGLHEDVIGLLELIISHPDISPMFTITSGVRLNARTKLGRASFHSTGEAIDIVPTNGYSFQLLEQALVKYPDIIQYMRTHGMGIYDETSLGIMNKTGATGPHFHIGKDRIAIKGLNTILNKYGIRV